ncbi:MAG: hypothetical protein L0219_20130 [Phycisphaerales bacterium]|nr:hypothetical protein [Phycisphaerales bacterium]
MLVVGGEFTHIGNIAVNNIAAWDGYVWRALDEGTDGPVFALTVFNNQLIVGGNFAHAGNLSSASQHIAAWTGSDWLNVGNGIGDSLEDFVGALAVFNGDLIVAGSFFHAGGLEVEVPAGLGQIHDCGIDHRFGNTMSNTLQRHWQLFWPRMDTNWTQHADSAMPSRWDSELTRQPMLAP